MYVLNPKIVISLPLFILHLCTCKQLSLSRIIDSRAGLGDTSHAQFKHGGHAFKSRHKFYWVRPLVFCRMYFRKLTSVSTSVKTIRPLSLPVPIPAQRARKPSQMQQKTNSSHLPPPAGPTGVHPDAVPLILFSLAYASRVQTGFLCCCNPTFFAEFCSHPVRSILFLRYLITSDHFDVNFV